MEPECGDCSLHKSVVVEQQSSLCVTNSRIDLGRAASCAVNMGSSVEQALLLTLLGAAGTALGGLLVVIQPTMSFKRLGMLQVCPMETIRPSGFSTVQCTEGHIESRVVA